jgi:hypothetical protein
MKQRGHKCGIWKNKREWRRRPGQWGAGGGGGAAHRAPLPVSGHMQQAMMQHTGWGGHRLLPYIRKQEVGCVLVEFLSFSSGP